MICHSHSSNYDVSCYIDKVSTRGLSMTTQMYGINCKIFLVFKNGIHHSLSTTSVATVAAQI